MTLLAAVVTNTTFRVAAGVPPGPEAVMIVGPEDKGEEMETLAEPAASVVAGLPLTVPRLLAKVICLPT